MTAPRVSFVVPTWNRRAVVGEAVADALASTGVDVEVVVVDDGSTDGTAAMLAECFAGESRLRVVQQANAGVSAARNRGVVAARGEFVAFLDSDDGCVPERAARQAALLDARPDVDLCLCDAAWAGGAEGRMSDQPGWRPALDAAALFAGAWAPPSTMCLRRAAALAIPFDESIRIQEDQEFLYRWHAAGRGTAYLDEVLARYALDADARLSDDRRAMDEAAVALVAAWHPRLLDAQGRRHPLAPHVARRMARTLVRQGRWADARPHCLVWWRSKKRSIRPLSYWVASWWKGNREAPAP